MTPTHLGIIGGGWRAEFYLRVARELPHLFRVGGMFVRDDTKGQVLEDAWGVPTFRTLEELAKVPDLGFVVVSVPWPATPAIIRELADRGIPALAETPPAPDLDGLVALDEITKRGARVQVAEQYLFQPFHAARHSLAESGKLGTVTQAQVSAAHGYHGVSLIRGLLGVRYEEATITARVFESPLIEGPGRGGPPAEEKTRVSSQIIAHLDFGDKLGVHDFTGDQYFSWIRSPRVLVRGERGEINNRQVSYLKDFLTPVYCDLRRISAGEDGNLEGYYLKGILAGDEWVYQNPFAPARLTDDEIAVATCLDRMAKYAGGGSSFYSVPEASQDHYLGMLIQQAVKSGEAVAATRQVWAA